LVDAHALVELSILVGARALVDAHALVELWILVGARALVGAHAVVGARALIEFGFWSMCTPWSSSELGRCAHLG